MGNRTPAAEANFYDDPEAALIVLNSGSPVTIYTLKATETAELTRSELTDLIPIVKQYQKEHKSVKL